VSDTFDIYFADAAGELTGRERQGLLKLGTFVEHLLIPVGYWSEENYVEHWQLSVQDVVNGLEPAYLITAIQNPSAREAVELWVMQRDDHLVVFENHLVPPGNRPADDNFAALIEKPTNVGTCNTPSQWHVSLDSLRAYLRRSPGKSLGSR